MAGWFVHVTTRSSSKVGHASWWLLPRNRRRGIMRRSALGVGDPSDDDTGRRTEPPSYANGLRTSSMHGHSMLGYSDECHRGNDVLERRLVPHASPVCVVTTLVHELQPTD